MEEDKRLQLEKLMNELTKEDLYKSLVNKTIEAKELKEQLIISENKIKEIQPKIEFYDTVTESDDMIEMSAVAKILNFKNIGRNKLFEFLRDNDVMRSRNEPYQRYVNSGYFKVIEQKVELPNGDIYINRKPVVYQKGLDFIRKLLLEAGYEYNK